MSCGSSDRHPATTRPRRGYWTPPRRSPSCWGWPRPAPGPGPSTSPVRTSRRTPSSTSPRSPTRHPAPRRRTMQRTVIALKSCTLKLADTSAGLATAPDYACQVSAATITAAQNTQTVPATGCAGESNVPVESGWTLHLEWLQDWTDPGGGLSGYAYLHDTEPVYFSLTLNGLTEPVATGQAYVGAGDFGGVMGTVATATSDWPCLDQPDITLPAATLAAGAESDESPVYTTA